MQKIESNAKKQKKEKSLLNEEVASDSDNEERCDYNCWSWINQ